MTRSNPFATPDAARRYREGRPDWTDRAIEAASPLVMVDEPAATGLDVGCGTGISGRLTGRLAELTVGVDLAMPMLRAADPVDGPAGLGCARAEHLPFRDASFDLIVVASALHWFDVDQFGREAGRVAVDGATLLVLDHWFAGQMQERPEFADWAAGYVERYPSATRDHRWQPTHDLGAWRHAGLEVYDHWIDLSRDALVTYLLSQSNLQIVVDRHDLTAAGARTWLDAELEPFFEEDERGTFGFGGYVACLRRRARH